METRHMNLHFSQLHVGCTSPVRTLTFETDQHHAVSPSSCKLHKRIFISMHSRCRCIATYHEASYSSLATQPRWQKSLNLLMLVNLWKLYTLSIDFSDHKLHQHLSQISEIKNVFSVSSLFQMMKSLSLLALVAAGAVAQKPARSVFIKCLFSHM